MKNAKVRLGVLLKFLIDNGYVFIHPDGEVETSTKADNLFEEYKKNPEGALMQKELEF